MSDYSFMKSGLGSPGVQNPIISDAELENIEILLSLFMTNGIDNAAKYVSYCKRNGVTVMDISLGLKYEVFEFLKRKNLMNDIAKETEEYRKFKEELSDEDSNDDDDGEEEAEEEVENSNIVPDEEVEPFSRINPEYIDDSNREFIEKMHEYYDTWDSWEPDTPFNKILKNAINKI